MKKVGDLFNKDGTIYIVTEIVNGYINEAIPLRDYIEQVFVISYDGEQLTIKELRYCWYWVKNQGTNFFHAKTMPIRKVEEICIFHKGKYNPQITDGHVPTNSAKGCSRSQWNC